jgi:DNA-binding NarL/FixJ family response regulator
MSNLDTQARRAAAPPTKLTRREIEILMLINEGLSSKIIAAQLFLSKRTVDFHLENVYAKLKVTNRVQACRRASQLGMISGL